MNTPTAIVFDLDGTLIDSAPDIHAAINHALAGMSRGPLDLAKIVSFIGNGVEVLVEKSLAATGGCDTDLHTRTLREFLNAYEKAGVKLTRIYPGVVARLTQLRSEGIKLGVCTNKPQAAASDICQQLGLDEYFNEIRGARDGEPKKPDAHSLLACIAELGSDPQDVLYVGDSVVDYQTAQNAGVGFILFAGGYLNGKLNGPAPLATFDRWSQGWQVWSKPD